MRIGQREFADAGKLWIRPESRGRLPCDVGQAEIAAVVAIGQPRVIDAQQVQDRGVQVVDAHAVDDGLEAEFVGLAVVDAALDSAAGQPGGEGVRIVVAAGAPLSATIGSRPNSPPQTTSVESSSPRCFRSVSRPAIGMSVSPANWRWLSAISVCPSQLRSFSMPPLNRSARTARRVRPAAARSGTAGRSGVHLGLSRP